MRIPDSIQNAPDLMDGLELYYSAFWDLDSSRPMGMGLGPIPWHCTFQYARMIGLDEDQTDSLFYHIRALDHVYLKYHSDEQKKRKK